MVIALCALMCMVAGCKSDPQKDPTNPDTPVTPVDPPSPTETLKGNIARPTWTTPTDYDYTSSMTAVLKVDLLAAYPELAKDYYYTYPDSLDKHVSKETYDKIVKYLQDNNHLNEDAIQVLSLSYIDSLLSQTIYAKSDIGNSEGVDSYFLQKAEKDGKTILEVESYELQNSIEKSFPDRVNELSIIDILDDMEGAVKEINELYKYWKEGNVDKLVELFVELDETEYSKEDLALMEQYNKKMLDERNVGMKEKLEEYFNNNYTVFYMVGTAHLIGDNGIAKLLEADGYTVTIVK